MGKYKLQELPSCDVIHISSMLFWRGGEQQLVNLLLGQRKLGLGVYMIVRKDSSLMNFCQLNNIPHATIKFNNGFNFFSAVKIKRLCKQLKVKTLHMHCSSSHTLGVLSKIIGNPANLILSRKVIFPVKANFLSNKKYNYRGISTIICVSESVKDVMRKTVRDTKKLKVIYDGIDSEKFKATKNAQLKEALGLKGKTVIGNISAISTEKDYYTFVDVAESIIKKAINAHFLIVGSGEDYDNIHTYILSKHLGNDITMLGFRKDVPDLLSIFDVFLMTSTMEGLGSTILDAFAGKVPVVATDVGGIPELVQDENTGLLSKPKDVDGLSANIIRLLNDKSLVDEITNNAYKLVTTKFSTDKMVELTNEVYKSIVNIG